MHSFGRRQSNFSHPDKFGISVNQYGEVECNQIRLRAKLDAWSASVDASVAGKDYAAGLVEPGNPAPRFWMEMDAYAPYFDAWRKRPEFRARLNK